MVCEPFYLPFYHLNTAGVFPFCLRVPHACSITPCPLSKGKVAEIKIARLCLQDAIIGEHAILFVAGDCSMELITCTIIQEHLFCIADCSKGGLNPIVTLSLSLVENFWSKV